MFFQHYHAPTNLSRKLEASLGYLQLQIGTPCNPFTLKYTKWGALAPLSWVKMLQKLLHHFDITLHMSFPIIPPTLREQDRVIMEIIFAQDSNPVRIASLNSCRGYLQALFLSDIATAHGKYLEHFVFDTSGKARQQCYTFPKQQPTRHIGIDGSIFWHAYTTIGSNLNTPLGKWIHPTHRLWHWYFNKDKDKLYHICGRTVWYFRQASGWRRTHSTTTYQLMQERKSAESYPTGVLTSDIAISETKVNKLQEGPIPLQHPSHSASFWDFIAMWGGNWMWNVLNQDSRTRMT